MGERANEMRDYFDPATPEYNSSSQLNASSGFTDNDLNNYASDTTPEATGDSPDAETEPIREDIEQTRREMARTVDQIQERLTPQNIAEHVKETAKETAGEAIDNVKQAVHDATVGRVENMVSNVSDSARETGSGLIDLIKENPIPAAMAGIGLGWLFMKRQDNSSQSNSQVRYATPPSNSSYSYDYLAPTSSGYTGPGYKSTESNSGLIGKIKENPIPAAIAGVSLGYMFMKGQGQNTNTGYSNTDSYGYTGNYGSGSYNVNTGQHSSQGLGHVMDKVGEKAANTGQKAGDIAGQVADKAGDIASGTASTVGDVASGVASGTADMAGNVVEGVQQGAQKATNQLERMLQENPLAVGGVAVVLGAVIGMMLPGTEKENQLMGKAHDALMRQAGEAVQQTMDKVGNVAEEVTQTAKEEAKNQGLTQ